MSRGGEQLSLVGGLAEDGRPISVRLAIGQFAGGNVLVTAIRTAPRGPDELKRFRRVATRHDKLAAHYLAFVQLAAAMSGYAPSAARA